VIVTIGGRIFQVTPLSVPTWLVLIVVTSSVLIFVEVARRLRRNAAAAGA
jgi:hypothetical protein